RSPTADSQRTPAAAAYLDRRKNRRSLLYRAGKPREHGLDRFAARPGPAFADDFALAVVGRAGDAPTDAEAIAFTLAHRIRRGLCRLADRYRQHTGRQRIEGAGVSGLAPTVAAHDLDHPVRGEAERLIHY